MSVWYCIASARPPEQVEPVLAAWRERGYKIALWRDHFLPKMEFDECVSEMPYPGYAQAVNHLARLVFTTDSSCDWIVTGGDDIYPDPNKMAAEIARECSDHFKNVWFRNMELTFRGLRTQGLLPDNSEISATFGVMQPTGDRWGDDALSRARYGENRGAYIDRVCGSPWMGREFCQRIYGGKGPLWPEFTHMYVDEHLQCVAEKLDILWQRPDLAQHHEHWGRGGDAANMPEFLKEANSKPKWDEAKAIFERLKAGGFAEAAL